MQCSILITCGSMVSFSGGFHDIGAKPRWKSPDHINENCSLPLKLIKMWTYNPKEASNALMDVNTFPDSKVHGAYMGPPGADRTQVGLMLAPWTLLSALGARRNGQQFADDIFRRIFFNENVAIELRSKFHWSLLLGVQLTLFQHWFR